MTYEPQTIDDYIGPLGLLCLAWGMFEDDGKADTLGGSQWQRMLTDWHEAGRPEPWTFATAWIAADDAKRGACE